MEVYLKYSENMEQIYKGTPMPKCDFSKVKFVEITLRRKCSPINLVHNFRTPPENACGGRLLNKH